MLKVTPIEILLRGIPEAMILIWGIYLISREKIRIKEYIFSSIVLAIEFFFVRQLPIHFGVHLIINNVLTICIIIVAGISITKAIYGTLLTNIFLIISEIINVVIIKMLNIDLEKAIENVYMRVLLGYPSLAILMISFVLLASFLKRKEGKTCV